MARRNDIDKEAIERDYRAGQLSFAAICKANNISKSTLSKFIKEGGWERDLTEAVKVATRAQVIQATIKQVQRTVDESADVIASGVDIAAAVNVQVVMGHRKDIQRLKSLAGELSGELEVIVGNPADLKDLVQAVREQEPDALPAVMRFASLANRVGTVEKLTATYTKLIALERQAFSLDDDGKNNADASVEEVLRAVHGLT